MKKVGGGRQYLVIDLPSERWEVHLLPVSWYRKYLGGEALGLYLWSVHGHESVCDGGDPFCIACGALAGSRIPCSESLSLVGRSPSTGMVEAATCITAFSQAMVSCGWDAVVLTGNARRPMVLRIGPTSVEFRTSERLIGGTCSETVDSLRLGSDQKALCIGPAGERRVSYASVVCDSVVLDRSGFGSLLGGKQLKAIVMESGATTYEAADPDSLSDEVAELLSILDTSRYVRSIRKNGQLDLVETAMREGFAAVENVSKRTDPRLFHLSGKECSRRFAMVADSCGSCPICCKREVQSLGGGASFLPEASVMMALGSNLGNYDPLLVMEWSRVAVDLGLDPVSTGMVVGWVMQAQAEKVVDWTPSVCFGRFDGMMELIGMIAHGTGCGEQMGKGVANLVRIYGGDGFASHVNGKEMVPYDPRGAWGQALLTGLGELYPLVPENIFTYVPRQRISSQAEWVVFQENLLAAVRSVGICPHLIVPVVFEKGAPVSNVPFVSNFIMRRSKGALRRMAPSLFSRFFQSFSGFPMTGDQLLDVGRRAGLLRRTLNKNADAFPAPIPERFLIDPESNHPQGATIPYRRLADRYRFLRSCDLAGIEEIGEK